MNLYVYWTAFLRSEHDERLILWKHSLRFRLKGDADVETEGELGFKSIGKMQQYKLRDYGVCECFDSDQQNGTPAAAI